MPHIAIDVHSTGARPVELALVNVVAPDTEWFWERIRVPIAPQVLEAPLEVQSHASAAASAFREEGAVFADAVAWLHARVSADAGRPLVLVARHAAYARAMLEAAIERCGLALPHGTTWECTREMGLGSQDTAPAPAAPASFSLEDARQCARLYAALFADTEEDAERAAALQSVWEDELAALEEARAAFAAATDDNYPCASQP